MVLVAAVAAFSFWAIFRPTGDEAAARAAAAEVGLTIAYDMRVETIDGGFRVTRSFDTNGELDGGYSFDVVETPSVSAPANASKWDPKIDGATAYAENDPPVKVFIDAGAHSWIVTSGTPRIYQDDGMAVAAWYVLAASISFAPAP